jgi:hypothetical protein
LITNKLVIKIKSIGGSSWCVCGSKPISDEARLAASAAAAEAERRVHWAAELNATFGHRQDERQ